MLVSRSFLDDLMVLTVRPSSIRTSFLSFAMFVEQQRREVWGQGLSLLGDYLDVTHLR
jgi:hypothetical protein